MGKRIENVLDGFNFKAVSDYMMATNWTWVGVGVPSAEQAKEHARKLLKRAKVERCTISTGGFIASYRNDRYSLIFYIDHNYED